MKALILALALTLGMTSVATSASIPIREEIMLGITDVSMPKGVIIAEEVKGTDGKVVKRITIKDDPGGVVQEYAQALVYAGKEKMTFRVDGMCASACTLILAKTLSLDVCVTQNAVFGVHKPYSVTRGPGGYEIARTITAAAGVDQMWKGLFMTEYPDWLTALINLNGVPSVMEGAKTSDLFKVDAKLIGNNVKVCTND